MAGDYGNGGGRRDINAAITNAQKRPKMTYWCPNEDMLTHLVRNTELE
jgi:hypothetical protein